MKILIIIWFIQHNDPTEDTVPNPKVDVKNDGQQIITQATYQKIGYESVRLALAALGLS